MKSLYLRIVGWFLIILLASFLAFTGTTALIFRDGNPFDRFTEAVLSEQGEQAADAYETRGAAALAAYLQRLDRVFPARHRLLDSGGRDLLTGEQRPTRAPTRPNPLTALFRSPGPLLLMRPAREGRYQLLMESRGMYFAPSSLLPYYAWIVVLILLLCYALAFQLVSPLRRLRETLSRFGAGDFTARTGWRRRDEYGDVGRAFDKMAGRLQTLLTAERRLLQDISHELRSPLARLAFAVELALTAGDREAALDKVKREVRRLSELVGQLIEMTRAEGDPDARAQAAVSLSDLVNAVAGDCLIEADAKNVRLIRAVEPALTTKGDPELLRRAIENVLRNAIGHSPKNAAVEIALARRSDDAWITIRDHGPGVPPADLDNILLPFFRLDNARARDTGGVGLGLAIASRAVRLHNGEISAANASPGLCVTIRLPLAANVS